jgi:predicted RNA binding protein YcfA (HicA-like mRNA interferase family)
MSQWPSTRARQVLAALLRIGWTIKRQSGTSHRVLTRAGWPDYVFAFHDYEEIGPKMLEGRKENTK